MKNSIRTLLATLLVFSFTLPVFAQSTTTSATTTTRATSSTTDLLAQIQELLKLVTSLQTQLDTLKAEQTQNSVPSTLSPSTQATAPVEDVSESLVSVAPSTPVFTHVLLRNSSGPEVHELQVFLASLPGIYPEGLITNFYGPLTEKAVQRFQAEYGIADGGTPQTTGYGVVGVKTRAKLHELMTEGAGRSNTIPQGLLSAPGIQKKLATTTQEGTTTIPAIPAIPRGQTGTTTIPALPAQPATNATSIATSTLSIPIVSPGTPPLIVVPTPIVSPGVIVPIATTTATTTVTPSPTFPPPNPPTSSSHSCGTPVYVPRDFSSIQTALNSACSGDTVFVSAGTYYENIKIPRSRLTLKGAPGTTPGQVIIDGGRKADVVAVNGVSDFAIDGFTLTNGGVSAYTFGGDSNEYNTLGAGLVITPGPTTGLGGNAGVIIVQNLIVKNNSDGVIIRYAISGTITVKNNLIVNNGSDGFVLRGAFGLTLAVINNTIAYNGVEGYVSLADGMFETVGSQVLKNNIIVNNGYFGVAVTRPDLKTILYNNVWNNTRGSYYTWGTIFFSPSPGTGELSVDPKFVSSSDYHLQSGSPMINAGDPSTFDPDGSRADMGAYPFVGVAVTDTTPPVISNVAAVASSTSATITWSTNEAADTQAEYGFTSTSYGTTTSLYSSSITNHIVSLCCLDANTTYHYRVKSKDATGNLVTSGDYTFTTPALATLPPLAPMGNNGQTTVGAYMSSGWPVGAYGMAVHFNYDGNSISQVAAFRLYQRKPGESAFSLVDTFSNPAPLYITCSGNSGNVDGSFWRLSYSCSGLSPLFWTVSTKARQPWSYYSLGDYEFYVTAVNSIGGESSGSPIRKISFVAPTVITNPLETQSPVAKIPTFQWTGSGRYIQLYDEAVLTGPASPIYTKSVSNVNTYTYDGPALDPSKKYVLQIDAPSTIQQTATGNDTTSVSMVQKLEKFWVTSATTTASVSLNNLASIIASLMELLQKIQSTL